MAINKYTQPIQARYTPTSVDPNLMMTMLQKKEQETALVDQNMNTMEGTLAGIKAYGDEDSALLERKRVQYNNELSELYDKYGQNPNLMLHKMKGINKKFSMDAQSGDLARIQKKYTVAQEDLTDMQERVGTGKLTQAGARAQQERAGTGWRAQEDPGMFKNFSESIQGNNYADDIYNGQYELALMDALRQFQSTNRTQFEYMNEAEREDAILNASERFTNKWRSDTQGQNSAGANDTFTARRGGARLNTNIRSDISLDPSHFKNGKYVGRSVPDGTRRAGIMGKGQVDYSIPNAAFGHTGTDDIVGRTDKMNQEQVQAIASFRKMYGLPENMTDMKVSELIISSDKKKRASFVDDFSITKNDSINSLVPSLVDALPGAEVWINGKPDKDGDTLAKVAKEFGISVDKLLQGNLLDKATATSMKSLGERPGSIMYQVQTNNGVMNIEVATNIEALSDATTPSWTLGNAIVNGHTGDVDGVIGVDARSGLQYNGVEIIGDYDAKTGEIKEHYILYQKDTDGNKVYLRGEDGLRIETSYDKLRKADLDDLRSSVAETKKKPKYQ